MQRLSMLLGAAVYLICIAAPLAAAAPPAAFSNCSWETPAAFDAAVQHFSQLLQFKTVSSPDTATHAQDIHQFELLNQHIESTYSSFLSAVQVEHLGAHNMSWLITWPGSQPELNPALFISHVDVVPVADEEGWQHPPFSGALADGYIWGRGTLDVKIGVVGLLEAAAALHARGFTPSRTLMFAFGHDEEVGGARGAAAIASSLKRRNTTLEMIWDEGSAVISDGFPPLVPLPFALVGTSEKTYQTLHITLHSRGGHSSMPPSPDRGSIAARLGRFLVSLTSSPAPAKLVSPTREFVAGLAAVAPAWLGPLFSLAGRFPVVGRAVAALLGSLDGSTTAMVRDTAAVTSIAAGVADNVLPQVGTAAVNFRLLPGSGPEAAEGYVKGWLGPDAAHANITLDKRSPPVAVTDSAGPHFALLKAAVQQVWRYGGAAQPVTVLPFLMPGGTDSKHYAALADAILRFIPYSLSSVTKDVQRVHGTNERISVEDFARALCTYSIGLQLAGAASLPASAAEAAAAAAAASALQVFTDQSSRKVDAVTVV